MNNTGAYGNPMTYPYYLFGAYSDIDTGLPPVVAADQMPKKLNNIEAAVSGTLDSSGNLTYVHDLTKAWAITEFDGRNGDATVSASFNITPAAPSGPTGTAAKNLYNYQPPHRINNSMPNGLGRNYGYLDGHCEFKLFQDWPGASYGNN